jgi:hypothetical protein
MNLEVLSWALQTRWLWLRKTQPDRPWTGMDIQVHPNVTALFSVSVISMVEMANQLVFGVIGSSMNRILQI